MNINELAAIALLLVVITIVILRLPKVDLGHSPAFQKRRVQNWLPMGLTYAFLYMGRYNLAVSKLDLKDFSLIFMAGTITYGVAFLVNGPLTDRIGGKRAILLAAFGAAIANGAMGLAVYQEVDNLNIVLMFLYAINMYFQSFGAVAIVKVNASWFHVRERGTFGAIFGILISLGIYFAFDWGHLIVTNYGTPPVFFVPAVLLSIFAVLVVLMVRDSPSEAGFDNFDTADASSGDEGPALPVKALFAKLLSNRIILTIAGVEFCSGFLRQAIMQYFRKFSKGVGVTDTFVYEHWGILLCCAGILGGTFAGIVSDKLFASRRGPVASVLYMGMLVGSIVMVFIYATPALGALSIFMSMCVIGVHGMLSGTASMDFGGRKNAATAAGIIDGFVYAGTGVMAGLYSIILPEGEARADPANWAAWPVSMVPVAMIGLFLASRLWNAKPKALAREQKATA